MSKGNISVNTENILPVIKKWLYSDKDIFIRELVSNGCDAIAKLKHLGKSDDFAVKVTVDKKNRKLIFSDNGIGMTADEIEKYIAQVAFSGAEEFLQKYKGDSDNTIIGHFGLGFYSAFMVADKVEIDSLSYEDGAKPAHWSCDGGTEYDIEDGTKSSRGTDIILHINEENNDFLEYAKVSEILRKYCYFLPADIYIINEEEQKEDLKPFNDKTPLWLKNPSECSDEEYINFYHTLFMDFEPPLFWIHLNVDYPFNLKGILYFPKLKHEASSLEGQIKLYNNQVFVADNIKEVIPEYLLLLKGCLDCPDLPLNVSRSFLQNDGYVNKVSSHITKKVSDKLLGMFNTDRDNLEKYWDDISPFVKYGCMRDENFYEKINNIVLYRTTDENFVTLSEYFEGKEDKTVYYTSNPQSQAQYIEMFKKDNIPVVILPYAIDTHFISFAEFKNRDIKFKRIDSSIGDTEKTTENNALIAKFKEKIGDESLKVECSRLKNTKLPAVMVLSEESRRMQEMSALITGKIGDLQEDISLILNLESPIISKLAKSNNDDFNYLVSNYIYDIATLANRPLSGERMSMFIDRSNEILSKLCD